MNQFRFGTGRLLLVIMDGMAAMQDAGGQEVVESVRQLAKPAGWPGLEPHWAKPRNC